MVNKNKTRGEGKQPSFLSFQRMHFKHLFTIILALVVSTVQLIAQDISKYYAVGTQEPGNIYFIYPQKGFKTPKGESFIYDITYLSPQDSLSIKFTYSDRDLLAIDSLGWKSSTLTVSSPVKKIYIEASSKWIYRYEVKLPVDAMYKIYSNTTDIPEINLFCADRIISFEIKKKNWKKYASINHRIFDLIHLNNKK